MKKYYLLILGLTSIIGFLSCSKTKEEPIPEPKVELKISSNIINEWSLMSLKVIKESPENSPTYASRSLGYLGLGMYEASAPGSIIYQSIAPSMQGLSGLPLAIDSLSYDWELSINASQSAILKAMYPHASAKLTSKIDSLEAAIITAKRTTMLDAKTIENSVSFGKKVATAIIEWAKIDGGHEGYKRTFDGTFKMPVGIQFWIPPRAGQSSILLPMHPYWGENRTFVSQNKDLPLPDIIPFSLENPSPYFKQMQDVYLVQTNLTIEGKERAIWWGDDPSSSASPPGHSYYLAQKLVKEKEVNLFDAASIMAKTGMSVADAFINTWKCKYHFNAERPTLYIRRVIDINYSQFWPEPPFPAFTSGHSTQAAAAATALIGYFGDNTPFIDDYHEGRTKDVIRDVSYKSRSFNTIWAMAEECGYSRIEGGIHTQQDNLLGLREGKKIGENVNGLPWKRTIIQ